MKRRLIAAAICASSSLALGQPTAVNTLQIEKTAADYSEEARLAELEGTVSIAGIVGDDGHPHDLRVRSSLGLGLDEQALEAATQQSYEAAASGLPVAIEVRFHLASKYSRWHLIHAEFHPPEGASRPLFASASYPPGAGILSGPAIEEGRLLGAIGREGTAAISFTIDERGVPGRFRIENASEGMWGIEAIAVLSEWRFKPGTKEGAFVSVPARFELAWGPLELNPNRIALLRAALNPNVDLDPAPRKEPPDPKPIIAQEIPIEIVRRVQPTYSQEALEAQLQGAVLVSLTTQPDGSPSDLRVVEGLGKGLDEKAMEALAQWRFKPVFVNGIFLPQQVTLRVDFKLK